MPWNPRPVWRGIRTRFQGKNFDANMQAAQVVRDVATAKKVKPGQIALAWLLHK